MENKDNEETIEIRRCDLHSIFVMLSLNNKSAIKPAWETVEIMMKKEKKQLIGGKE